MSLSTIFITVTARQDGSFTPYPVNVDSILGYPATTEKNANTRIDLKDFYRQEGQVRLADAYSDSQMRTALFVKETAEEITQKIQDAKLAQLELFKKSGVALII